MCPQRSPPRLLAEATCRGFRSLWTHRLRLRIAAATALPDRAALLDAVGRRSTAVTTHGGARRTLPGALRVWGLRGVDRERERSADAFARCCAVVDLGARGDEDDAAVGIRLARLGLRGAIGSRPPFLQGLRLLEESAMAGGMDDCIWSRGCGRMTVDGGKAQQGYAKAVAVHAGFVGKHGSRIQRWLVEEVGLLLSRLWLAD